MVLLQFLDVVILVLGILSFGYQARFIISGFFGKPPK